MFYRSQEQQMHHLDAVEVIRATIKRLELLGDNPEAALTRSRDLFDAPLERSSTLTALQRQPINSDCFNATFAAAATAMAAVLKRQYASYFDMEITSDLREQTESASLHNMDSEEMMGMYSALAKKSPSACMDYLSSVLRSAKNKTTEFVDKLEHSFIMKTVTYASKKRKVARKKAQDLTTEILQRIQQREQVADDRKRRKIEKALGKLVTIDAASVAAVCPTDKVLQVVDLLTGHYVGHEVRHKWGEEGGVVLYFGEMEECEMVKDVLMYNIFYWPHNGTREEDGVEYAMSGCALAADFILDDLYL